MAPTTRLLVTLLALLVTACGSKEPEGADVAVAADVAPTPPPPPPHPTTEEGILTAFTQALEQQDIAIVRRYVDPELGADLTRLVETDAATFWKNGAEWVTNAKTGLSITARNGDPAKVARWNALVRFGNGQEERVTFTRADGKLLLADL